MREVSFSPIVRLRAVAIALGLTAGFGACSSPTAESPPAGIFEPADPATLAGEAFFDHPWPSDLRRDADGKVDLSGFYNPRENALVKAYIDASRGRIDGFSPVTTIYFRFTHPIDTAGLPTSAEASKQSDSTIQLVDVDPNSPEFGKRRGVIHAFREEPGVYVRENTLAILPSLGHPLRPKTMYAAIVTRALKSADGHAIAPSPRLRSALGLNSSGDASPKMKELFGSAQSGLEGAGVDPEQIAQMTVFTTGDPTAETFEIADWVRRNRPAPQVEQASLVAKESTTSFDAYEGTIGPLPNFQHGKIPFRQPEDGGEFKLGHDGPIVADEFSLRFVLVVPSAAACPMPQGGYPIVLYAHGTGGDYRSVIRGERNTGASLAESCLASLGTDQIFHGTRPGAPPLDDPNRSGEIQLLFFNMNNPLAMRTSSRQSAIDLVQLGRVFSESGATIPAAVSKTGSEIRFDGSKLLFFGHSQGGMNGPEFLAADPTVRGGVLSGTGAMIGVTLLEKTEPEPSFAAAVRTLLSLARPEEGAELDLFHPAIAMAQTVLDPIDRVHYLPRIIQEPRAGFSPKSVYQTEGIGKNGELDTYEPNTGIEIASIALGVPRALPGVRPIPYREPSDPEDVAIGPGGLSGNLGGGAATGVLAQFEPPAGSDGHFVVFRVPEARAQATGFMKYLADDPKGRVPPL